MIESIRSEEMTGDLRLSRGRVMRIALVLALTTLLAFTLLTVAQDEDNSYMDEATYEGSDRCGDCHDEIHTPWEGTQHAGAFAPATGDTVVADWEADTSIELAPGVTVTPVLIENSSGFFMDLDGGGTHVYHVTHIQGTGYWLQVYVSEIGNSRYILPLAWANTLQVWVPFDAGEWYDGEGSPRMAEKHHVWDLKCGACHTAGFAVTFNDTSGEWTGEWAEDGVTCESCHGPGSLHVDPPSGGAKVDYIWRTLSSDLCGNCHAGMTPVGNVNGMPTGYPLNAAGETIQPGDDHTAFFDLAPDLHPDGETVKGQSQQYNDYLTSRHARSLPTLLGNDDRQDFCLMCHSTDYKLAEEGEEPTLETAEHDIECALCHDMHGTSEENNLRLPMWDTCVQCHRNGDRMPGEDPLPPQKEMVEGTAPIGGLSGDHWMGGIICTDCHMPMMGVREAPYDVPSHTWYLISPGKSIDLGMPNSCTVTCHHDGSPEGALTDEEALAYIEDSMAEVEEMAGFTADDLEVADLALEAAAGLGFSQEDIDAQEEDLLEARFALDMVERDNTYFHNPDWQKDLLTFAQDTARSVATALETGTVTGKIIVGDDTGKSGLDIKTGNVTWDTTDAEGVFLFDIAPGAYTFEVWNGETEWGTFDATVVAGETTDKGDMSIRDEVSEDYYTWYVLGGLLIVVIIIVTIVLLNTKVGEGKEEDEEEEEE